MSQFGLRYWCMKIILAPTTIAARSHRRRRHRLRRVLWLVVIILALSGDSVPPERAVDLTLAGFTHGERFNWEGWETQAVLGEVEWWVQGRPSAGSTATQKQAVLDYVHRQRQIERLQRAIGKAYARLPQGTTMPPPTVAEQENQLASLRRRQEKTAPIVERILSAQVAGILLAEGFGWRGEIWPPVTFRFSNLPTYLIISPRNEIRTYRSLHLKPALSVSQRVSLETKIEQALNISALVDDLGGISSWPTMVTQSASLQFIIDTVAHEWTHTYLMFLPLGQHYNDNRDLRTMNETVASMVGEAVAQKVLARYYPELLPPNTSPGNTVEPSPVDEFSRSMRRIRLHVDDLLAQGRVEAAENYMEAERQKLVAKGYYIRRLNQAYFAFHGSYATSPSAVDPIGPWMRQLRQQSGSLKAFIDQVAQMDSLNDLLAMVEKPQP